MHALINAGGKGTRMGACGIEKPMQRVGGKPCVQRVIDALCASEYVDGVLVSVSDNTPDTERYLRGTGIDVVKTSGNSFMDDLHEAFSLMSGEHVLTCPSDIPLLSSSELDRFCEAFCKDGSESFMALVNCRTLESLGITPSYKMEMNSSHWAVSGISIMDRKKTLNGDYLRYGYYFTDCKEFAVNVNTIMELELARKMV